MGEKCHGVLTLQELAEIELYLVRQWVGWAKHALKREGARAGDRRRVEPKGLHRGCRGQGERRRHPGANTLEMVPTEMVQGQRLPLATLDDNATAGMH